MQRPRLTCEPALLLQDGGEAGVHVLGHGGAIAAHIHTGSLPARPKHGAHTSRQSLDAIVSPYAFPQAIADTCAHTRRTHSPAPQEPLCPRRRRSTSSSSSPSPCLAIRSCTAAACCCIRCCTYTLWAWARENATSSRSRVPSARKACSMQGAGGQWWEIGKGRVGQGQRGSGGGTV